MSDPIDEMDKSEAAVPGGAPAPDDAPDDASDDLSAGIEQAVVEALAAGDDGRALELIGPLHYADVADLIEHIGYEYRIRLIEILPDELATDVFLELDETVRDEVVERLGVAYAAAAVTALETDDAVQVIEDMDEDDQKQILEAVPSSERALIEESLSYPEDSAGRLMQREVMTVPEFWTVGDTIDFIRRSADSDDGPGAVLPEQFYDIFVVDPLHKPLGSIALSRLLRARRPVQVRDIMDTEMKLIPVAMDQEDVAYLFSQRDLVSAPVIDESGRLAGVITVDDVVDVIHEEHEEDIMLMAGVKEDDLYEAAVDTVRARFTWLLINLGTAILASIIIGMFEATIDQIVALAVLMPIVASMGGNAGTQTLAVTVRALAMKDLTSTNAMRVIGKELLVGGFNGIMFAVLTGVVAWGWFSSPALGLVIALAMIVNMVVAGLAGTTIPLILERNGIDPAVSSSVFLTTVTDIVGFAVFLGLAALFLL